MAKKRVTRKQLLKEPDEFLTLSGRAALFVREHSRQFKYLGGAIATALLIYLGIITVMGMVLGDTTATATFRLAALFSDVTFP